MNISVAIVEDQKETREMLQVLINGTEGFSCLAVYENAEDALKSIPGLNADVVLVDINLPQQSGIECVRKLRLMCPAVYFIMCTSLEDTETIFAALKAGATGYITKATSPSKILEAIDDVSKGGAPMSSQIARKVVGSFQQDGIRNQAMEILSEREKEILGLLSQGYRYKEIGGMLFISIETVRKHIHNIYRKLQVNSRTDALNKTIFKK